MAEPSGGENIFGLDGPTATGSGLLRAAARATARNERGLALGFDLQARLEGALDAKLTDAARATFRASGSASVAAEAAACFPMDIFDFAGVVASIKFQAEARAGLRLDAELQPARLLTSVLSGHSGSGWLPYVEVIGPQIRARAGLQASAAVCVKAAAETRIGIRLFSSGDEPAGAVLVINFGYGFIYGYSWGVIAELEFIEPAALVRDVFRVSARQLAEVFEREGAARSGPVGAALREAAQLVEMALPAVAGMLCTLVAELPGAERQERLETAVTTLGIQLGQHLVQSLLSAALQELERLLTRLGLPVDSAAGGALVALLHAVEDVALLGDGAQAALPGAVDAAIEALSVLVLRGTAPADRQLFEDVAIGVWAGTRLLLAAPDASAEPPSAAMRRLLAKAGVDMTGPVRDLPARALGRSAARLLARAGAAQWLGDITGLTIEQLLRLPRDGFTGDPTTLLRDFLAAAGSAVSRDLLDEIPPDAFGLPAEAVEAVRSILRVGVEELPGLLDSLGKADVLRRLRERVSVGLLQTVGPPLVAFMEKVANEGFDQAVPQVRRLAAEARELGDLLPRFPRGGPLERFAVALEDLGRETIDVTVGLPTSELLAHLANKLDRWRTGRLPVELRMMRRTLCLEGENSAGLLARLDASPTSVVLASLEALAEHHLEQIRSISQFILEDSVDLLGRLTRLPFEQAARLFAAFVRFGFEMAAALIAELQRMAADLDAEIARLEAEVAARTGEIVTRCGELADMAAGLTDQLVELLITDLVGNDPVARFAAGFAFDLLTGGIRPVVSRVLDDLAAILRAVGESVTAAARSGTLGSHGALDMLQDAVRSTGSQHVSIPITILVPIIPPFWFETVTLATVELPAEWLGAALWHGLLTLTGTAPLLAAIGDTAASLQLTHAALEAARAAGTPETLRQRASDLRERVGTSYRPDPITIAFDAGPPESVITAAGEVVVSGHVHGIDRSSTAPFTVEDGTEALIIPARVRFTCQGAAVPHGSVAWTETGPREMGFSFRISVRAAGSGTVTVRPGLCVISCLAAAGAWAESSDDHGSARAITFLLAPDRTQTPGPTSVTGWAGADGTSLLAYAGENGRLALLERPGGGNWSVADTTALVPQPRAGSGLTGWTDGDGSVHLVYAAATGGMHAARRTADGTWTAAPIDGRVARVGRPQQLATADGGHRLAYVDGSGHLHLAVRTGGAWATTDVTESANLPPAAPSAGLAQWSSRSGFTDDVLGEGNLLGNAAFDDGPRHPWEAAARWTTWAQGRRDRVLVTDVRPSSLLAPGSARMLHVAATIEGAGLVHNFADEHTGPPTVDSAAWVYVVRGEVGMGTGDGGNTHYDTRCSVTGRWVRMSARNGVAPANEFILYASRPGGTEFFVAGASVRAGTAAPGAGTAWHLAYGGANGHICRATYLPALGSWQFRDLSAAVHAPAWRPDSDLTAWLDSAGHQHVAYWAEDGRQREIVGSDEHAEWQLNLLGPPAPGRRPARAAAATLLSGGSRILVGSAPDDSLRTLASPGGAKPWTAAALPGPVPASRESISAWADSSAVMVAVIGADRQIHLAARPHDSDRWSLTNLCDSSSAPRAAAE